MREVAQSMEEPKTDKAKALTIWLRSATQYDFIAQNTPATTEMHTRHFEETCGFLFNPDGSWKYFLGETNDTP